MTKEELLKRKQQIEQVELPKVSMLKQRGGLPYMIGGAVLVGAISYKIKPNILVTLLGLGIGAFAGKNSINSLLTIKTPQPSPKARL